MVSGLDITGVDNAVGVPDERHWYVALTNPRHEKTVAESLRCLGLDSYVAAQRETHHWKNGRRRKVDRVVISCTVFLRCTERERLDAVRRTGIRRFLTDRASSARVAIIPDEQIHRLRFMLGQSDIPVEFDNATYGKGDRVRVVRGILRGLEGEVINDPDGSARLLIRLDLLGTAACRLSPLDLQPR